MEADLQRHYGVDYRDRWRRDSSGRRVLTMRRLKVLIDHMPVESELRAAATDAPLMNLEHVLLADIWQATARSKAPHPLLREARSKTRANRQATPQRRRKLAAAKARRRDRLRRIDDGEIT